MIGFTPAFLSVFLKSLTSLRKKKKKEMKVMKVGKWVQVDLSVDFRGTQRLQFWVGSINPFCFTKHTFAKWLMFLLKHQSEMFLTWHFPGWECLSRYRNILVWSLCSFRKSQGQGNAQIHPPVLLRYCGSLVKSFLCIRVNIGKVMGS